MLLVLDSHNGVPIFRQIIDQIRFHIVAGTLKPGEQVTSVKDLAAMLRVNPMTVSKAYSLLEHDGFFVRKKGVGLFVADLDLPKRHSAQKAALRDEITQLVTHASQLGLDPNAICELVSSAYAAAENQRPRRKDGK